jgi:Lar family restriction alleviation protein
MDHLIDDGDRLKPCPFCGGDAMFAVEQRNGHPDFGGHSAMCATCGAVVGYVFACGGDPTPLLLEQWNKRAALEMWAVHVQGPDDLHACPDRKTADALALVLNQQFMRHQKPDDPIMVATVTEWPYGRESWKQAADELRFVAVDA